MLKRDYPSQYCPVASTLEVVGERWTLLIIRDVFLGIRRFDDIQRDLGVARNILQARLERLVEEGILVKRPYQERPLRCEYRLTEKGADLWPVLVALLQWGDRYGLEGERPMILQHRGCGGELDDRRRCLACGADVSVTEAVAIRTGAQRPAETGAPVPAEPERPSSGTPAARLATVGRMSEDTAWLDATAQAELVRTKEVSPAELVGDAIARMEKLNPQLNAVIHELFDRARAEAAGELPDGPFRGVPFLLKDLGAELAGTPFNEGTDFSGDYRSTVTQELTQRYIDAGFVICGKTNTPELGILPTAEPRRFGAVAQPVEHRALHRRLLGRVGRRGGVGHGAGRARQRRRRLDPDPRLVLRPGRAEADAGAQLAGAPVRRHDGRPRGRARGDALGARLGGHPRRHRRARCPATPTGPRRGAGRPSPPRPPARRRGLRIARHDGVADRAARCTPTAWRPSEAAATLCESLGHQVEEAALAVDGDAFIGALHQPVGLRQRLGHRRLGGAGGAARRPRRTWSR